MESCMSKLPQVYSNRVPAEWIDYNGHMGDFAYNIAFSRAADGLYELFGLDPGYRERTNCTIYTLETRTGFYQECNLGDALAVECQVLDVDEKRVHMFLRMYRAGARISWRYRKRSSCTCAGSRAWLRPPPQCRRRCSKAWRH